MEGIGEVPPSPSLLWPLGIPGSFSKEFLSWVYLQLPAATAQARPFCFSIVDEAPNLATPVPNHDTVSGRELFSHLPCRLGLEKGFFRSLVSFILFFDDAFP